MRWSKNLFVGERLMGREQVVVQGIKNHKFQPMIHVITSPINENNVLEIYPSTALMMPYMKEQNLMIMGIAADYTESLEVVRSMVEKQYNATGNFHFSTDE